MLRSVLMILAVAGLVSACTSTGPGQSEYCHLTGFIYVAEDDVLSDRTAIDILKHNELRKEIC